MSIGHYEVERSVPYPKAEMRPLIERSAVIAGQIMGLVGLGIGMGVVVTVEGLGLSKGIRKLKEVFDLLQYPTSPDPLALEETYLVREEIK